jgi:antitoxin (DNA-binding transcriptional repressor) of toxin-antitoxin stability system
MYHMIKASIRDLRYGFKRIERLLRQGEEIQITNRRRVVARLIPETGESSTELPDFLKRLRAIYGEKILPATGADVIAEDRSRY